MDLSDIINRVRIPTAWSEGEKIPWHAPGFSQRMLAEHLSQKHDLASRRYEVIDQQVHWLQRQALPPPPARLLDLGCGPGLYTSRLARAGYQCIGIDYSPASIEHARQTAQAENLDCSYLLEDVRTADFGGNYDLVMMLYGEINVFHPKDARLILRKARLALNTGGRLVLEVSSEAAVQRLGAEAPQWNALASGLFCDGPHLLLSENFWDPAARAAVERFYVVETSAGTVNRYAAATQAYSIGDYRQLLTECGFQSIEFHPSLDGSPAFGDLFVILAR